MNGLLNIFRRKKQKQELPKRKIYCIPGFGADDKIFTNLSIDNAELIFINWLKPLPKESYKNYVLRMAEKIQEPAPVIIGVSFGGMVALEIAKTRPVKQVILVSSIKNTDELPGKWKLIGRLRLNHIFPIQRIQANERFFAMANKRLGALTKEEQDFANHYRRIIDKEYMIWALNQILNWRNAEVPANVVHIHGDADLIFPIKPLKPTHIIHGGTHMMIMNRAAEISAIINKVVKDVK
ncbi:alpha/beta hydrolase [Niabella yanshanensis]|uniref:Alpha/beta hydrolase n=1 Tax=Niabella yanshanensis TaxID=577386 RepID=A0ABZ0WCL8_9BACT|nr:alpha/beta hydrolase [Niabella yanshanensis]WQD40185.1 alpha/beta hydrolase [Niabella yanshanensis]